MDSLEIRMDSLEIRKLGFKRKGRTCKLTWFQLINKLKIKWRYSVKIWCSKLNEYLVVKKFYKILSHSLKRRSNWTLHAHGIWRERDWDCPRISWGEISLHLGQIGIMGWIFPGTFDLLGTKDSFTKSSIGQEFKDPYWNLGPFLEFWNPNRIWDPRKDLGMDFLEHRFHVGHGIWE